MSPYALLHVVLLMFLVLRASTSRVLIKPEESIPVNSASLGKDNTFFIFQVVQFLSKGAVELRDNGGTQLMIAGDVIQIGTTIANVWPTVQLGLAEMLLEGKNGDIYVVTDPTDHDAVNPKPGTLRYGVIQSVPLWIIFEGDMNIQLSQELIMNSYKTIDGRGANVHISNGPCITVQFVSHVIIHGINIHDCKPGGNAMVRDSPTHFGWRTISDGDGISLFGATNVWIDHCTLAKCTDGLIDAIVQSTAITISNNHFSNHDKVMLLGHSDEYPEDKIMQVTVAYNHFGEGLIERMPRCRYGYFHVVNNDYTQWEMYAVGGSSNPTINVEGNRFLAPIKVDSKEVTKREYTDEGTWKDWNWRSEGNMFLNGAYFVPSGSETGAVYSKASSPFLSAKPATSVQYLTANAGVLSCSAGSAC